jgi:hypothetical protein
VSFVATTRCVASQRVFIFVAVYFVIDSVWKLWILARIFNLSVRKIHTTELEYHSVFLSDRVPKSIVARSLRNLHIGI